MVWPSLHYWQMATQRRKHLRILLHILGNSGGRSCAREGRLLWEARAGAQSTCVTLISSLQMQRRWYASQRIGWVTKIKFSRSGTRRKARANRIDPVPWRRADRTFPISLPASNLLAANEHFSSSENWSGLVRGRLQDSSHRRRCWSFRWGSWLLIRHLMASSRWDGIKMSWICITLTG